VLASLHTYPLNKSMNKHSIKTRLSFVAGIATLTATVIWWTTDSNRLSNNSHEGLPKVQDSANTNTHPASSPSPENEGLTSVTDEPSALMAKNVATWMDTEIDGSLKQDSQGNLIVDLDTRDFFDYMLSAVGDESTGDISPEQVLAFINQYAQQNLSPTAAAQAMELLDDYLAFKESAQALRSNPLVSPEQQTLSYQLGILAQTFTDLKLLRRSHMNPQAVDAFFGDEEAYGEFTLAQARINTDTNLTPQQKAQQVNELRWQLPESLQLSASRRQEQQQSSQATQAVLNSSSSTTEKRAQLLTLHSEAMVDRILTHQQETTSFQQQFDRYLTEKQSLEASQADPQQHEALFQRYFTDAQAQTKARTFEARLSRQ
jgi:lipase chaperone LimK